MGRLKCCIKLGYRCILNKLFNIQEMTQIVLFLHCILQTAHCKPNGTSGRPHGCAEGNIVLQLKVYCAEQRTICVVYTVPKIYIGEGAL